MQLAKLRFHDSADETNGLFELARRFRVITILERDTLESEPFPAYYVPLKALELLDSLKIPYELMERCSLDCALEAL